MRTLKDSKQLGIDSVEYIAKNTSIDIQSNPSVAIVILSAIKFGADWQLRTSERNYRKKKAKIIKELQEEADDYNERHKIRNLL